MTPTHEELLANIKAMESQGAQPQEIQSYLDRYKGQTPGQPMVVPQHSTLTPDQSSTALGGVTDTLRSVSIGATKGAIGTLQNIGQTIAQPIGQALGVPKEQIGISPQTLAPEGTAEKVGQTAERVGEFFTPGGLEKGAVAKGASYIEKLPELLGLGGKAATALVGSLKTAFNSLVSGASMGGVSVAQTGDISQAKGTAELGAFSGGLAGLAKTFGPEISQALNKADFRLTPMKEAKTQKIADSAAKFITDNKILGSNTTKFAKLGAINGKLESALQNSLPEGVSVAKSKIAEEMNKNVELFRQTDESIYNQARSKADEALKLLQERPGDSISIKDVLANKRSWGSMAFKTSAKAKQDPTVASEGAYAVEQAYQKSLEGALDSAKASIQIPTSLQKFFGGAKNATLQEFNKVYSNAINAKNLTGIAQYKSDAGLFGRYFGLWVGKTVGQTVMPGLIGEIMGAGAGEIASSKLPGVARNIAEHGLAFPGAASPIAKVTAGVTSQNPQGQETQPESQ